MDPLSTTASVITLLEALAILTKTTASALEYAETLARVKEHYGHIESLLKSSKDVIDQLNTLKSKIIETVEDHELRDAGISPDHLQRHLEATEALRKSLETHQKKLQGVRKLWSVVVRQDELYKDLQRNVERFRDSMGCLSILLCIFQTRVTLSQSTKAKEEQQSTHDKLDAIAANQAISHNALDQLAQTMHSTNEICLGIEQNINALALSTQGPVNPEHRQNFFGIPYPRNRYFTGREELLQKLEACLLPGKGKEIQPRPGVAGRVFCIYGLPGLGKTHTAIEFAYRQEEAGSFSHIFWITADTPEKLSHGFAAIPRDLGIACENRLSESVDAALSWLRKPPQGATWLLILDNVDNFDVLNKYWSSFASGSILLTSRDALPKLAAVSESSESVRLVPFTPEEGTEMLKKRFENLRDAGNNGWTIEALARRFGFYPLYMDQMASFIEADPMPLSDWYYRRLTGEFAESELQDIDPNSPWYSQSIAKAIEQHISRLNAEDRLVLSTIAFFDPDNIPERLLLMKSGRIPNLSTPVRRQATLQRLARSSFIHLNPARGGKPGTGRCINIHRLVCEAAIRTCFDVQAALNNAMELLCQEFRCSPSMIPQGTEELRELDTHFQGFWRRYLEMRKSTKLTPSWAFIQLAYTRTWYTWKTRGDPPLERWNILEPCIDTARAAMDELLFAKASESGTIPADFLSEICLMEVYYNLFYWGSISHGLARAHRIIELLDIETDHDRIDPRHPSRINALMYLGSLLWLVNDHRQSVEILSQALNLLLVTDKTLQAQSYALALNYLLLCRSCCSLADKWETARHCFDKFQSLRQTSEFLIEMALDISGVAAGGRIYVYISFVDFLQVVNTSGSQQVKVRWTRRSTAHLPIERPEGFDLRIGVAVPYWPSPR